MVNYVIKAKSIDDLNHQIVEFNKNEWVVKQIYCVNENLSKYTTTIYALLEKQGNWR